MEAFFRFKSRLVLICSMKIYTKTGDKGETSLIGGVRVPKYHLRIEAYGTVDELNSYLGYCAAASLDETERNRVKYIQDRLFTIGSNLASDPKSRMVVPDITESDISDLEEAMDNMNTKLPELKNFILPGGSRDLAMMHVARCVCRRAERLVTALSAEAEIESLILRYLNRLSDYVFVLARYQALLDNQDEITWSPRA